MTKSLVVLGATGSIGRQTVEVADRLDIPIAVLVANRPSPELVELAQRHPESAVVAAGVDGHDELSDRLGGRIGFGADAVLAACSQPGHVVVNGIVGAAGLAPTVAALDAGNRVALANKESLVAGGPVVADALRSGGGELIPVDSEHSALWQCLVGEQRSEVRRLVLTASGGPFRGRTAADLEAVTVDDALEHPTWSMGPRITVDSATLANKAMEVIEAHHLFEVSYDAIDVVVHPQSVIHSIVEFVDGSQKAQLGDPDMRLPIQLAITWPHRAPVQGPFFDLAGTTLTFEPPDRAVFPALDLGYAAGRRGGSAPAAFNAADEVAVEAFLKGRIRFADIPRVLETTLDAVSVVDPTTVDEVLAADGEARSKAAECVARHSGG